MIVHIVVWRLKEANKIENAAQMKAKLEALCVGIPEICKLEVGIDFSQTQTSSDVVLYSEFQDRAALQRYQIHPDHQAIVAFIKEVVIERRLVDYERP